MTRAFAMLLSLSIYALSLITPLWASALPSRDAMDAVVRSFSLDKRSTSSSSSSSSSSSGSSSKTSSAGVATEIIDFLQVMMEGGIQSQQCWITLVNATQSDIGDCLGLSTFSTLVVQGSNSSFATAVDDYLTDMCSGTKCDLTTLKYWKYKIEKDCAAGSDLKQPLLKTLSVVLENYESSLYDLACKVHYNGTAPYCLSEVLNATQTTNSKDFFNNILTGTNVNWYDQSFFGQPICTGCMHEFYKAAMFLIPSIRSWTEMVGLGHVLSSCQSTDIQWQEVCDQQKPDALSVEAAVGTKSNKGAAFNNRVNVLMYVISLFVATLYLLL